MTIKERRLIAHFLDSLKKRIENRKVQEVKPIFLKFFSRSQLIEIIKWMYDGPALDAYDLEKMENEALLEAIGDDMYFLSYTIEKWNEGITATPKMTQTEVHEFFDRFSIGAHYLRDKPVEQWDEYDRSNYYAILYKHGKTRRVFAIYTSDVKEEDKYVVTTQPSFFFDTKEEAEEEMERCYEQGLNKWDSLKVMSLWKIE